MSVTIGVPYYDSITPEMFYAVLCAIQETPQPLRFSMAVGPLLAQNREWIVTEALESGSERLVFVDTDLAFPPDALARLLIHDFPIIGGMYHLKHLPLENAMKLPDETGTGFFTGRVTLPSAPIRCAILPAGFLSLHLPTLQPRLTRPWFEYGYENGQMVGEDVMFCRKAHAAGLDVWCDPTIPIKHLGRYAY